MNFKPQLLPNNKKGEAPDWENIFRNAHDWLFSNKLDGARVEIHHAGVVGRSLKSISSVHVNQMAKDVVACFNLPTSHVIEAEFYSPNMTFSEIIHFFKTEDVTSKKTKDKYNKLWERTKGGTVEIYKGKEYLVGTLSPTQSKEAIRWNFPDRTPEWLTQWHPCLKFYAFDCFMGEDPSATKVTRTLKLADHVTAYQAGMGDSLDLSFEYDLVFIPQNECDHVDEVYQMYDQAIMDGYEGVVAIKRSSTYKCGRHSLKSAQAYKIKEDNLIFDGQIIGVPEATVAREGAEKTINELGRSVTSKLKDDRVPAGMAKGFRVIMDDGIELTVSLNGYDHDNRRHMFENPHLFVGRWIQFTGMAPVKAGGAPRHAMFTRGNFRDSK